MKTSIFTIADYVTEQNGKLIIIGSFDNWISKKFPFRTTPFGIAIKSYAEDSDYGKEKPMLIEIKLQGKEKAIFTISGKIRYPAKKIGKVTAINTMFMITSIDIEKPGIYEVICKIDNKVQSSFFVEVKNTGPSIYTKKLKRKKLKRKKLKRKKLKRKKKLQ